MDAVFSVVFARRFSSYFSIGGDIRYYYKKLVTTKANSAGFDAGAMVHLAQDSGLAPSIPINLLRFGLVVRNISAKYPWQTGDYWGPNGQLGTDVTEKVPIIVKAGVSALTLKSKLLLAVDVQERQKEGVSIFTGGEYWLVDAFALRTGLAQGKPTFGVGFKVPFQKFEGRIDIAVEQAQNVGGWESIFGFTMGF